MTRMNLVGVPRNDSALQTVGDFLTCLVPASKTLSSKRTANSGLLPGQPAPAVMRVEGTIQVDSTGIVVPDPLTMN